jgi:predicted pyridoxine 5'-phosphate oxidase superfamily flavin-nucleotide-binding protein
VTYGFLEIASTPSIKAAQAMNGSAQHWSEFQGDRTFDRLTQSETDFIAQRDSFYMATVSSMGWPYIQHRGGPIGFLRVLGEKTLGFADLRGNRQYINVGNIGADGRTALILMDYPNRQRLKLYALAETRDLQEDPHLHQCLALPNYGGKAERVMLLHLEVFDWNCPQHITPRFTETELAQAVGLISQRMSALEEENRRLRSLIRGVAPGDIV